MKTSRRVHVPLFMILALSAPLAEARAGEGTIPLRVTGRVVESVSEQGRHVSNAPVELDILEKLPEDALTCLGGAKSERFIADGSVDMMGSVHEILALCLKRDEHLIE